MNRSHLISDIQIDMLRSEVQNIKRNTICTPDTDASYKAVVGLLNSIQGSGA